tara:strand:- start:41 stop:175 length:135 start_codon:yes stop_codon:yes gene_type:complete
VDFLNQEGEIKGISPSNIRKKLTPISNSFNPIANKNKASYLVGS